MNNKSFINELRVSYAKRQNRKYVKSGVHFAMVQSIKLVAFYTETQRKHSSAEEGWQSRPWLL